MAVDTQPPLLRIYETAVRIRRTDDRFLSLLNAGEIQLTYYSPMGQEIISACVGTLLNPGDYVVTTYRGLHDHIATGVPLDVLWAEFLGRQTGTCKGKGGPMHITHPASGLMVTTGLVGAGLPIANGLALSSVLRQDGRVTVVNFGDGASNIGAFHEALNLAALWNLPVVFLCQNNRYGEKTAFANHTRVERVADRAASYGMPGVQVDGNDVEAMWEGARDAINRARSGQGPILLEAMTFRFRGHNFGDDNAYIPEAEMAAARAADPVPRLRGVLLERGVASEEDLVAIEKAVDEEIDTAVQFAMSSPMPPVSELGIDVYAQEVRV